MRSHFQRNVSTTAGFFVVRFVVSLCVAVAYIFVAAAIQYAVVGLLGESTFNYLVGGLLSLFLGVIICERIGALVFMFVRGWHVAALAYVNKIRKSHAPAVTVGMKAFAKNIVGFGAVYGVRIIAKNLLSDFKDKLWDLLQEVPYAQNLRGFSENPIVQHMAGDVLNYGFDATIFYLIKNPPEDVNEVPSTVMEGLKRYLYCLPSIMLTSIGSYILFRFIPQFLKWLLIVFVFVTQGILPGILITVLMWPVFYILSNTFFKPLTMIMFISCFSKECEKEIDKESPTVQFVDSVLDGADIGTSADDIDQDAEVDAEEVTEPKPRRKASKPKEQATPEVPEEDMTFDVEPDMSEVTGTPSAPPPPPPSSWMRDASGRTQPDAPAPSQTQSPTGPVWDVQDGFDGIPFVDEPPASPPDAGEFSGLFGGGDAGTPPGGGAASLASLLRDFNARDLSQPAPGYEDGEGDDTPSVEDILSGGDF